MGAAVSNIVGWDNRVGEDADQYAEVAVCGPPNLGASVGDARTPEAQENQSAIAEERVSNALNEGQRPQISEAAIFQGCHGVTVYGGNFVINQQDSSEVNWEQLRKILDFLSLVNFRSIQEENLAKWTEGTLNDFIEGAMFQLWLVTQLQILWGTGMPGAGKTVLADQNG